ncbi:MAG: flagellin [Oscillospiraceae bacterium]
MRVTDSASISQYISNNHSTLSAYLNKFDKVLTQQKFNRASEDSVGANSAMRIRKQLENLDMYDTNLQNASDIFTAAETSLYYVSGTLYNTVNTKLVSIQSTKGDVEFEAIGNEIMQQAEAMVKALNVDSGGRQLLAGTSNNKEPFTYKYFLTDENGDIAYYETEQRQVTDADGNLTYTDVNGDTVIGYANGTYKYEDGTDLTDADMIANLTPVMEEVYKTYDADVLDAEGNVIHKQGEYIVTTKDAPGAKAMEAGENDTLKNKRAVVFYNDQDVTNHSDKASEYNGAGGIFIDVGYGIKYDSNGNVVPSTAMDIALNGAKFTGCGIDYSDDKEDSNNMIQLTFDAARAAYNGDLETCNRLIDKLSAAQKTMLEGITELGVKQNNIDFHISKDSDYRVNLQEKQNDVEGVDLAEVITQLEAAQASYNAALRLGAQAVPQSIFSFI